MILKVRGALECRLLPMLMSALPNMIVDAAHRLENSGLKTCAGLLFLLLGWSCGGTAGERTS